MQVWWNVIFKQQLLWTIDLLEPEVSGVLNMFQIYTLRPSISTTSLGYTCDTWTSIVGWWTNLLFLRFCHVWCFYYIEQPWVLLIGVFTSYMCLYVVIASVSVVCISIYTYNRIRYTCLLSWCLRTSTNIYGNTSIRVCIKCGLNDT